ncbi:MAG: hypothetical protein KIT09_22535 [Bryobacteraceae bacterium]|nr:hypothetical protein [Bryobacteraceae bacterium]
MPGRKEFWGCFVLLAGASALALRSAPKPAGGTLIVCGWDEVYMLDAGAGDPKKIWSWRAADRTELPEAVRSKFATTDECKPVDGGKRILITASSDGVALVERDSGKAVFWATAANAHSAEMLPSGRIAVAASHRPNGPGDRVVLFDVSKPEKALFHAELSWAHGVVWDDGRKLLWAIGHDDLVAYRLEAWDSAAPSLAAAASYRLPDPDGHDLRAVPGTAMLSLSTGNHCWLFDRDARDFRPHPELAGRGGVKSIDVNPATGQAVWVLSEGGNWWSGKLRFLNPEATVTLKGERIYKARWLQ